MTTRGYELTAWVWLSAAATGCGGWVDLENPRDDGGNGGGSTSASGGTTGKAGASSIVPPEAGTGGEAVPAMAGNGAGGSGGSVSPAAKPFYGFLPPPPSVVPLGADGAGVTWNGIASIDTGSLEAGVLVGGIEYCFRKPQSGYTCDWLTREPFVWTEAGGIVPLNDLVPGGERYYPRAFSEDGETVVGSYGTLEQPVIGFFRWKKGEGATTLGEPPMLSDAGMFISSDGRIVAGSAKQDAKSFRLSYIWSEAEGFHPLSEDPTWPANAEVLMLSDDGSIIIGQIPGAIPAAFQWKADTGAEMLGTLPGMAGCTALRATSDAETVFGYCQDAAQQQGPAFRWRRDEGMVPIADEAGPCMFGGWPAFSAEGDVLFNACGVEPLRLLRWTDEGTTEVPLASSTLRSVLFNLGTDSTGSIAFGTVRPAGGPDNIPDGSRAFRWTEEGGTELLSPLSGDQLSSANMGHSSRRVVIGHSGSANGVASKAVLWDETGALDIGAFLVGQAIDLGGFELQSAERLAVQGDTLLIQGVTDVRSQAGVWFARIPIER